MLTPAAPPALTRRQRSALPGSGHDQAMAALKWLLPALAVVLLLVIVALPLTRARELSFLLARDSVASAGERLRLDRAVYRGVTADGDAFTIRAASAVQRSSADPVVDLTDFRAVLMGADGPANIAAPSGRYFLDEDRLTIAGPVTLRSTFGYSLDSKAIAVDLARRRVSTDAPVSGRLPIGGFRAGRLQGDLAGRHLVLDGGVHLRLHGRAGRAQG